MKKKQVPKELEKCEWCGCKVQTGEEYRTQWNDVKDRKEFYHLTCFKTFLKYVGIGTA